MYEDFDCQYYAYDPVDKDCYVFKTCNDEGFDDDYTLYVLGYEEKLAVKEAIDEGRRYLAHKKRISATAHKSKERHTRPPPPPPPPPQATGPQEFDDDSAAPFGAWPTLLATLLCCLMM